LPGRTLTILRGEPAQLPDPPPPPPVPQARPPEQLAALAARRAALRETRLIQLSATVYDHRLTYLRWFEPKTREWREAWSNVDFNHLTGCGGFDAEKKTHFLFLGVGNIDTAKIRERWGRIFPIPAHPALPAGEARFVVTKGDATDAAALAPIQALHDFYMVEKDRLAAAYEERERNQRNQAALLKANPPRPKDNVMWVRPRKGSRYLAEESAAAEGGGR
jgi:hypothetical protein